MLTRLKIPEKGGALRLISASLVSNRLFGGEGRPSLKYPPLAFHPGFRPIPVDRRRSRNALLHGYTAKTNQAFGPAELKANIFQVSSRHGIRNVIIDDPRPGKRIHHRSRSPRSPPFACGPPNSTRQTRHEIQHGSHP